MIEKEIEVKELTELKHWTGWHAARYEAWYLDEPNAPHGFGQTAHEAIQCLKNNGVPGL